MTAEPKATIKTYFMTGDRPSQDEFGNLIDSYQDANATLSYIATASPNFLSGTFFGATGSGAGYIDRGVIRVSAGVVKIPSFAISSINSTPVGDTSPSTGAFTTLAANSATIAGAVTAASGNFSGNVRATSLTVNTTVSASSAVFNGTCRAGTLQADTVVDYHSLYIKDVIADDYDFVRNTPYAYTINQFRGVAKDGNFRTLFKKNNTTFFTQVFASATTAISTTQSFAVGDNFSVTVSGVSGAVSGAAIYARHTRAL